MTDLVEFARRSLHTASRRLSVARSDPQRAARVALVRGRTLLMSVANRWSRRLVTGSAPVIVSMTSHGHRIALVHLAVESIARGVVRPQRVILWLNSPEVVAHLPPELRRLQRRGLEVLLSDNYGPHTKYYPHLATSDPLIVPLVVADDDIFYPRTWLKGLLQAHRSSPDEVVGYRAHQVTVANDAIQPYSRWRAQVGTGAGFDVFCTGVSGTLLPIAVLRALREAGEAFEQSCPRADDIWIHAISVRNGYRHRQIYAEQRHFHAIPGSQRDTLHRQNVINGGNDLQVEATYSSGEIARVSADSFRRPGPYYTPPVHPRG